jgi:hypothetical protein
MTNFSQSEDLRAQLLDRLAIRETLEQFCVAVDTVDRALMASCFAPQASVSLLGGEVVFEAVEHFLDHLERMSGVAWSSHSLSNVRVRLHGDEAETAAVVIAVLVFRDGGRERVLVRGVNYTDGWRRGESGWRIASHWHSVAWQCETEGVPPNVPLP